MPRSYRPYAPRKPTRAALAEADEALANIAVDQTGDGLSLDQRLERLSERVVRRMELDLAYFSIPQLLTGLQRCLQVRVLLLTIQQKGGGSDVGSAVKRYSSAFQHDEPKNDPRDGKANRRPEPDDYANILELIAADDADEPDESNAGSRPAGKGRVAGRNRR